jgi:hypothetical protein
VKCMSFSRSGIGKERRVHYNSTYWQAW